MAISTHDTGHRWTVADLDDLPDDGQRYEIVDGVLHVSPGPTWRHNTIASRIARQLEDACPAHLLVVAPAGGLLIPRGYLIADLAVVDAAVGELEHHAVGPAQVRLVVEVASPSTALDDRRDKTPLYAEAGIASYWRVELLPTPRIVVQELHDGAYAEVGAGETVRVEAPFPVEVSL